MQPSGTSARAPGRVALGVLYTVFFLSGAAGLGYEIVWTRLWSVGLGHEVPSMLAVVAAFFGGLALGAYLMDGPISRSARPARWYVGLELALGAWALATVWIIPFGNELVARLTGVLPSSLRLWTVAFGLPFALLLPATAAMGATLPAMDRLVARLSGRARNVGGLYAINTLGAVAGTLGSAFLLVPALGLANTVLGLAALNFLAAAAVAVGFGGAGTPRADVLEHTAHGSRRRLLTTLFFTGLFGIGYEVLGVRVIGQVLENTVYSFASALSVYLVGTALGAALYQHLAPRSAFERVRSFLLQATCIACLAGIVAMSRARSIYELVASRPGFGPAVAAELTLAAAAFLLPALFMGATFAHLAQGARRADGGVGVALGVNTLGGALAPLLFGVVLLPALGPLWSLVVAAAGYALLLLPARRPAQLGPALVALLAIAFWSPDLRLVRPPEGGRVVEQLDGVMASVAVVSDELGRRYLKVNDRFRMGSSGGGFAARRSGHLPLLLHPAPETALFLGLGAGTTFRASGWHPGLRARCVELLPEVLELRPHFVTAEDPRAPAHQSLIAADARRYVRATDETFDVIVADLFHPARDGSGALYTREHFEAVRARLAPGGLFCQWLPLYQLEPETLRVVLRTFLEVFEHAAGYLSDFNVEHPVLGLVGGCELLRFGPDWYDRRVRDSELRRALERVALRDLYQVAGCCVADRAALVELAGAGPLNLDDRPLVNYLAPRLVYARMEPAGNNLRALLERHPDPTAILEPGGAGRAQRLRAYWTARDHYLEGELAETPELRVASLLFSAAASTDFATSYHTLLLDVENEGRGNPDVARAVLDALILAHPQRPEARALRAELFGG